MTETLQDPDAAPSQWTSVEIGPGFQSVFLDAENWLAEIEDGGVEGGDSGSILGELIETVGKLNEYLFGSSKSP